MLRCGEVVVAVQETAMQVEVVVEHFIGTLSGCLI
jgi:hypothetical protein